MGDFSPVTTPMVVGCKLCKDDESPRVYQNLYRSNAEASVKFH